METEPRKRHRKLREQFAALSKDLEALNKKINGSKDNRGLFDTLKDLTAQINALREALTNQSGAGQSPTGKSESPTGKSDKSSEKIALAEASDNLVQDVLIIWVVIVIIAGVTYSSSSTKFAQLGPVRGLAPYAPDGRYPEELHHSET